MSRWRWGAYLQTLHPQVACDAIDTGEARTTLEERHDGHGRVDGRIIRLHTWANDAWTEIGSVTMDRNPVRMGPALPGQPLPLAGYNDAELTLHTAAVGGAGNAGVATYLFPAVLGWINRRLRGVQRVVMNPAGGAASKSVVSELAARIGGQQSRGLASAARAARKAAGGPAIAGGNLNTWDTRLNAEHFYDLDALNTGMAGLAITGDGMSLAGPALPGDIAALQGQRDGFVNQPLGHLTRTVGHPGAPYFEAARALTDQTIAADPRSAGRILRMALLSSRSGAAGMGGAMDAGYQMHLSGAALAHLMPSAVLP